jgi:phospholipid/cholesterol/gamma-HCH transport system substrate-binding protein
VGSAVLFNGIRVGEVTGLGLNAGAPEDVIATIAVASGTPIRTDTEVTIETQGLTGGAAVALRGGSPSSPLVTGEDGALPTLIAAPQAGQDWTQSARAAFQRVDQILADNSEALHSAITNIDTFSDALARNSDKVDGILAGLERMTGGGSSPADIPVYDLAAATTFPGAPKEADWLLVVPEPTTLMGFNTDKILLQPADGESVPLANARWSDNVPILVQEKVIQSFENAGLARSVSRSRDGVEADFQLIIDIRFFHVSTVSEPAAGEIDFIAKILDKDGKFVGASTFQGTAPAQGADPKAYVTALNEVFVKLMSDLVVWTTEALAGMPQPPQALDEGPPPPVTVAPPETPDQPIP